MSRKLIFFALLAVFALVSWHTSQRLQAWYAGQKETAAVREEVDQLKTKNSELLSLLQYLQTDAFVEREGRLRFGLGKAGEKQIVVVGDKEEAAAQDKETDLSNPQKWWRYFTEAQKHKNTKSQNQ